MEQQLSGREFDLISPYEVEYAGVMYSQYPGPEETKIFSTKVGDSRFRINVSAYPENGDDTAGRINDYSISLRISYSEVP